MGGKKSRVWITAKSSETRKTAPSSRLSNPTSSAGSGSPLGNRESTRSSTPGPSLAVQPPPLQNTMGSDMALPPRIISFYCIIPRPKAKGENQKSRP